MAIWNGIGKHDLGRKKMEMRMKPDPVAHGNAARLLPGKVVFSPSLPSALEGADTIILMTGWRMGPDGAGFRGEFAFLGQVIIARRRD